MTAPVSPADPPAQPAVPGPPTTPAPGAATPAAPGAATPAAPGAATPDASTAPATAGHDDAPAGDEVRLRAAADSSAIRRAPRLGPFVVCGVLLGALAAFLLTFANGSSALARSDLFWLLFLSTGLFGGLLGALVFLVADRRSLRRRDAALDTERERRGLQ